MKWREYDDIIFQYYIVQVLLSDHLQSQDQECQAHPGHHRSLHCLLSAIHSRPDPFQSQDNVGCNF